MTRKYGQLEVKVWTLTGARWHERTLRNLSPEEFAEQLREAAKRLETMAAAAAGAQAKDDES